MTGDSRQKSNSPIGYALGQLDPTHQCAHTVAHALGVDDPEFRPGVGSNGWRAVWKKVAFIVD